MKAFHGDIGLKHKVLGQVKQKITDGLLEHGTYGERMDDGRIHGCAVFVTTCATSNAHQKYPKEYGIPEDLARLEDTIFEHLKPPHDREWPVKFLEAIKTGADLTLVSVKFRYWLMQENLKHEKLWRAHDKKDEYTSKVVAAINQVADMLKKWYETGVLDESAAWSARSAAWSARSAAGSAAESAARSAAESARSAAWSAGSAAWSARSAAESAESAESAARSAESARSAAGSAAEGKFYIKISEKLLELMKEVIP